MILSDFYLVRNRMTVTYMRLYLFHLTCKIYYRLCIINEREQGKYLVQTRLQAESSGINFATRGTWCR